MIHPTDTHSYLDGRGKDTKHFKITHTMKHGAKRVMRLYKKSTITLLVDETNTEIQEISKPFLIPEFHKKYHVWQISLNEI